MKKQDLANLRETSIKELEEKVQELKSKLADLRIQLSTGKLKDVKSIKKIRKEIAQMETIITEKKMFRNP